MTNGIRTDGTSYNVDTGAGPGVVKTALRTRIWNGVDYPDTPPVITRIVDVRKVKVVKVHQGNRIVDWEYKPRLLTHVQRPPKRARYEEHPYEMSDITINDEVFEFKFSEASSTWYTCTSANTGYGNYLVEDTWDANDDIALLGKLREKVAGSSFNAGVFLGEGREALAMILDAAARVRGAWTAAKKGNFSRATHLLTNGTPRAKSGRETTSSNWLQLQYGWLPLLADAHDGAQFLAQHVLGYPLQHVVRVSRIKNGSVSSSTSFTSPLRSWARTDKGIKCVLKEVDVVALSGLTDPVSVAWELVPYSFVIDWFIPIGNYLSARGLAQSLTGTFVISKKFNAAAYGVAVSIDLPIRGFRSWKRTVTFSRTVSNSLSVPMPSVKPLQSVPSWKRAMNALALLSQVVR